MRLERLTPHLGARVTGVDLAGVGRGAREELRALLETHLVLFFADQSLDPPAFRRLGEAMGELEVTPLLPSLGGDLAELHYVEAARDQPRGTFADRWHTDVPFRERPPYGAILKPEVLPSIGGDTIWASMYAAYEALPDSLRRLADELQAVHTSPNPNAPEWCVHPVVRVNPATGRRGLYVSRMYATRIVGLTDAESRQLLELFFNHAAAPDFQVRWRWSPDIVAMWDNRFTQHYAVADYAERRRMLRLTLNGDRPIGIQDYRAPPVRIGDDRLALAPIEARLRQRLAVSQVCLFGGPDATEIHVIIETPAPIGMDRLTAALRGELSGSPRAQVHYAARLARDDQGQVDRAAAMAQAMARLSPPSN
jgi:taurine dioxygenase